MPQNLSDRRVFTRFGLGLGSGGVSSHFSVGSRRSVLRLGGGVFFSLQWQSLWDLGPSYFLWFLRPNLRGVIFYLMTFWEADMREALVGLQRRGGYSLQREIFSYSGFHLAMPPRSSFSITSIFQEGILVYCLFYCSIYAENRLKGKGSCFQGDQSLCLSIILLFLLSFSTLLINISWSKSSFFSFSTLFSRRIRCICVPFCIFSSAKVLLCFNILPLSTTYVLGRLYWSASEPMNLCRNWAIVSWGFMRVGSWWELILKMFCVCGRCLTTLTVSSPWLLPMSFTCRMALSASSTVPSTSSRPRRITTWSSTGMPISCEILALRAATVWARGCWTLRDLALGRRRQTETGGGAQSMGVGRRVIILLRKIRRRGAATRRRCRRSRRG